MVCVKKKATSIISSYKDEGVIDDSNSVMIDGEPVEITFLYCRDCFGFTLQGIILKSGNSDKLLQKAKVEFDENNFVIDKHLVSESYDMIPR